ncbi:TrkH family potassium uptake protein [Micrococcus flavus]|uniref:Trk-type K+ transport system membrane component n=1 Tax=Micrococcus flavus TaxID=384602 RepID=A0A4Y8X1M6_9MICC|nr:potassium transporter TrkG [Micrococcus flavus]MBB4882056.1 Trk-type K+ transport system membrane component [Micrococcus flavus]TFI02838.1 TrkH family potassium uptake protein [Micrococcus flavus]GGK47080.1 potassium transporter Trk [Micrococcus flavus]
MAPAPASALRRASGAVTAVVAGSPARAALSAFALGALLFTALLTLPIAAADGRPTALHDAMFTAVSAFSVTGLTTVDTSTHWSFWGHLILLAAMQIGGLGILSMASLLTLAVSRHLGLRTKLATQEAGMTTGNMGEVGRLLRVVVVTVLTCEAALAVILVPQFAGLSGSWATGLWQGVFYSVSAFNNAGFALHAGGGIAELAGQPVIVTVIAVGVFAGALGFPVVMVLLDKGWRFRSWNLHTKLTVEVTVLLLLLGAVGLFFFEADNPATHGGMGVGQRIAHALFGSVMTRSGGFAIDDTNSHSPESLLLMDALMFVGGGSASTAGGIKVTTLAVMFLAIVAEARGDKEVTVHGRTIAQETLRVAISVLALGSTLVLLATIVLVSITGESLQRPLFEVISAFGTCGLSVGVSAEAPPAGKYLLTALMFAGRVGTITFAAALALRQRRVLYRYPVERPILG